MYDHFIGIETDFYSIYSARDIAGYLKVNTIDAQSEDMGSHSLEIERIYIRRPYHKQGLGKCLIDQAIEIAVERFLFMISAQSE